jgi:hypothetical protein
MASFDSAALQFNLITPVLRLNHGKQQGVRWVLWPVFAWRVVAPVPAPRKLNLFQWAVLGLARARVTAIDGVAERLLLGPELVKLVIQELRQKGLLDHTGLPTQPGLQLLDESDGSAADQDLTGHVFSDAFSGKLWPAMVTGNLPLCEVALTDEDRIELLSGSAGDPWRDRTFCVIPRPGEASPDRPDAADVLRAAMRHAHRRATTDTEDGLSAPRLQRVSFIDKAPQPYLFALRVRAHSSGDWMVDDPFSRGEAHYLRTPLEKRFDIQSGLRNWLGGLIGQHAEIPQLDALQHQALWDVEQRLTLAIRSHPTLHERLVAMQRSLLEVEREGSPRDKWDDVLVKAQRAAERIFTQLLQARPPDGVDHHRRLPARDKAQAQLILNDIAKGLGYPVPLPERLSSVRSGKVQAAEQYGGGSLRPLLVLNMLHADRDREHPLRRAAPTVPDLLHRLNALATARDAVAHDGNDPRPGHVKDHLETVYLCVEKLILR